MTVMPMPDVDTRLMAAREARFCTHVLAKSGRNVLLATLGSPEAVVGWAHYPPDDVFDPETGSQWYYHAHTPAEDDETHGHFHCFLRPEGKPGPIHHLVAVAVDAKGNPRRLFTTNQWVVGDHAVRVGDAIALLARFDVHMDSPSYLVNRWLSAILRFYEDDIRALIAERAVTLAEWSSATGTPAEQVLQDRALSVTSRLDIDFNRDVADLERRTAAR